MKTLTLDMFFKCYAKEWLKAFQKISEVNGLKISVFGLKILVFGLKILISGHKILISGHKISVYGLKISISGLKSKNIRIIISITMTTMIE